MVSESFRFNFYENYSSISAMKHLDQLDNLKIGAHCPFACSSFFYPGQSLD